MADLMKQIDKVLGLKRPGGVGRYAWEGDRPGKHPNLSMMLEGARVIVHSKPHGLWFAWHGGTSVSGYNSAGQKVVGWEAGTWKRDDVNAQRQVKASIRARIKTGDFK
jgi:hypothetical protein